MYTGRKEALMDSLEQRWDQDKNPLQPVKNEDLFCNLCSNKIEDKTCSCKAYSTKPVSVLKGGVCYEYKKANSRK